MRCLRCAGAPRRPATGSALSLTDLSRHVVPYVPGEPSLHMSSSFATRTCLRRKPNGSALPMLPISGLTDSPLLRPVELLASLSGDFYFRAFNGLVTLAVVGYNYGGNWTIPPVGLAPTRSAACVAAQLSWVHGKSS